LSQPPPILTSAGLEEYLIDEIIDSRKHGRGYQFLVRWVGYGHEHDLWIAASELHECEALNQWYKSGGDGPNSQ
jgi:Chromo (CHRromatin Organisation MOdifier) domain